MKRILRIDVCNYTSDRSLCNLYDSLTDVSGGAVNVFIDTERNGWKELSFSIPSVIMTEEGEEENFRLQFLRGDYRLKTDDGERIDFYLLSEPKITHDAFSKTVDVKAGHISQILKTKNLDLEFSDDEGNNIGTAEALLTTILEGSSWNPGNVADFKERNGSTKIRSLVCPAGTGCLGMIESMCDLFEAKPIYYGDTRTVDIVPMNPFSDVDAGEIPPDVLNGYPVHELHYEKNIHNLSRTLNTNTIATRLYAYGSSGDVTTGACTIQNAMHEEWTWTASAAGTAFWFEDDYSIVRYFSGSVSRNDVLIWSRLDPTSESYVWNNTKKIAYKLMKVNPGSATKLPNATVSNVQNYVPYLLDFNYYANVDLLTDEMFQAIAAYQRDMPALTRASYEAGQTLAESLQAFSELANPLSGFLKLAGSSWNSSSLTLTINQSVGDHGVIYRSDYSAAERRYFQWHVGKNFKPNGLPENNVGSIVLAIHKADSSGIRKWDLAYITQINGQAADYIYGSSATYPSTIKLNKTLNWASTDDVYLFCTNSMVGKLGTLMNGADTVLETIEAQTTVGTERHPVLFTEGNTEASKNSIVTYGWNYRYTRTETKGSLYFYWKKYDEGSGTWKQVYLADTAPSSATNGTYFFNTKYRTLHRRENNAWREFESTPERQVAEKFSTVVYLCRQRDYYHIGVFENYTNTQSRAAGNYAIDSGFDSYYTFTTTMTTSKLRLDTVNGRVYQNNDSTDNIVPVTVVQTDSVQHPSANEITAGSFYNGDISTTGVETDSATRFRSPDIMVHEQTVYSYSLPSGCVAYFYTNSKVFLSRQNLSTSGDITAPVNAYYVRITSGTNATSSFKFYVKNYSTKFYRDNQEYTIISATGSGEKLGINTLMKKFVEVSDYAYITCLQAQRNTQETIKTREHALSNTLGDLLRDGRWSDENYVKNDETRLYEDALDILKEIAMPETSYEFTYLDLFSANEDIHYYEEHDVPWPDIQITDAAHLVDTDINVNCWAYIDKIHKCYDQPWLTTIEIDTKLSLQSRHEFKDILARIAEVAKATKSKASIYDRAKALGIDGSLPAQRLEGMITLSQTYLNGGASNWYTDDKGNIILEAADGNSAMILGGRGLGVANSKNASGDWDWRLCATGMGFTADAIYTGYLSGSFIEAGTITAEKLMSNVGQQLDIGSNKSLLLFATTNGSRPAGTVKTTDALIEIKAGSGSGSSVVPAQINVASGGELNMKGSMVNITTVGNNKGTINLKSGGELNLAGASINMTSSSNLNLSSGNMIISSSGALDVTSGNFKLKSGKTSVSATGSGLYIGDDGINYYDLFKLYRTGAAASTATMYMNASFVSLGSTTLQETFNTMDQATAKAQGTADGAQKTADAKTQTYRCTSADIVKKSYHVGDTWINTDNNYLYTYTCTKVSSPKTTGDWILSRTALTQGAALQVDAVSGTIDMAASNTINVAAGATINIASGKSLNLISTGTVAIGNSTSPFTFGAVAGGHSYMYNLSGAGSTPDINTTRSGVYVGTDGVYAGNSDAYVRVKSTGSVDVKGVITATTGKIGAWDVTTTEINSGSGTSHVALHGTSASDYAFWAGADYPADAPFSVKKAGVLHATSGDIGGWNLGTDFLGNTNSISTATIGLYSAGTGSNVVIWSGGTQSTATFKVTADGELTAQGGGTLAGWTMAMHTGQGASGGFLYSGSNSYKVELDSSNKVYTYTMPISSSDPAIQALSRTSSQMAMWVGNESPDNAPFSVTKDGVVTLQAMRVYLNNDANGRPVYGVVNMKDWFSTVSGGSGDDSWSAEELGNAMSKLKFSTVRGVNVNSTTGKVTIVLTDNNGGSYSRSFNSAASARVSGSWNGNTFTAQVSLNQNDNKSVSISPAAAFLENGYIGSDDKYHANVVVGFGRSSAPGPGGLRPTFEHEISLSTYSIDAIEKHAPITAISSSSIKIRKMFTNQKLYYYNSSNVLTPANGGTATGWYAESDNGTNYYEKGITYSNLYVRSE